MVISIWAEFLQDHEAQATSAEELHLLTADMRDASQQAARVIRELSWIGRRGDAPG